MTTRVALVPNDAVGEWMAGPGIRYWEFARVLSQHVQVELIVPPFVQMDIREPEAPPFLHVCSDARDLRARVQACDVWVTRGIVLTAYPFLGKLGKPLVLDMYNPFLLEGLQRDAGASELDRVSTFENDLAVLLTQLGAGDFFICADEKQRDYWLGMLSAAGRVNPYTCQQDPTLRQLIDLAPFGLPQTPPVHTHSVLKGAHPKIAPADRVILWGGGIWDWLDAPTLIRAMPRILEQQDNVKLFFMGVKRPNTSMAKMQAVDRAIQLAQSLGLQDHILFNNWVPYQERENYLLEADIGASLHLDHIETRFSFRTRLLDYIWAGLPILATRGDVLSQFLAERGLARLVEPQDVEGVAGAVLDMLADPALRARSKPGFAEVAAQFYWPNVTRPLVEFCMSPRFAPDRAYLERQSRPASKDNLLYKSWRALRLGGIRGLLRQSRAYLRWLRLK